MKLATLKPRVAMHTAGPAPLVSVGWSDDRRLSPEERGYGAAWKRLRLTIFARDRYLCQCERCKADGVLRPATEVDHIVGKAQWKIEKGTLTGVDHPSNLQAINKECHKLKTKGEFRRAYQATGQLQGRTEPRIYSQEVSDRRIPKDLLPSRIPITIVCGPPCQRQEHLPTGERTARRCRDRL